jgi:hypothetical protein
LRDRLGNELDDALESGPRVIDAAQSALAESPASRCVLQSFANNILELGAVGKATAAASRHDPLGLESYRLRLGRN